jgi:hypothetical protein
MPLLQNSALRGIAFIVLGFLAPVVAWAQAPAVATADQKIRVEVTLPTAPDEAARTGRLFLFVGKSNQSEPRVQGNTSRFGVDVREARPGQRYVLDERTAGYPVASLGELPAGDYFVQAVFNLYTDFHRADGHVIWAHMDQWEGQQFNQSPGNLISEPQALHVAAGAPVELKLTLTRVIPPIKVPPDTEWVQRIKLESPMLSKFWGRPIYIGATVLLPKGYHAHPEASYPAVYIQGHFDLGAPFGFSPSPDSDGRKSWARQREEAVAGKLPAPAPPAGTKQLGSLPNTETGHEFYEAWTGDDFPRMLAVTFQHPTPYFDDSYGVNSPNCGPYGDAILQELMPALEAKYRLIRQRYARVLTGSSTGGWGSLALQLYYPETFGGAWAFSPDPVDFRLYYGGINLYKDDNGFIEKTEPGFVGGARSNRRRSREALILGTQESRYEWWKHTPTGPDGYPLPVWDHVTGKIDRAVVEKMRAGNFDLREFLARNWTRLGPQLVGQLHVCAADTDGYYSNLAVHLLDEFMRASRAPHVEGSFQYGPPGSTHGWRPTTNAVLVGEMAAHIAKNTPAGESPAMWHYK